MNNAYMIKGQGVSAGIGIGKALVYSKKEIVIPENKAIDPAAEIAALDRALAEVVEATERILENARKEENTTRAEIIEAYSMILQDPEILAEPRRLISDESHNAAAAVEQGVSMVVQMFESMEDEYMRERAFDIRDIKDRILMAILGIETKDISALPAGTILVAKDLTTSDTASMDMKNVAGIMTQIGGRNSHTSIMARNFSIPAVVGIGDSITAVGEGDFIVFNGVTGEIVVNPDKITIQEFQDKKAQFQQERAQLDIFKGKESISADGRRVEICSNIGTDQETAFALECTADGIGLFRSEFLFLDRPAVPTEDEQFDAYKNVLKAMGSKPVIVRTLDIGGDKEMPAMNLEKEENPFLGYRAIRICLDRPELFRTQLRALLRASVFGNLQIMFPMISSVAELRAARESFETAKAELQSENIPYASDVKIGIMIEIPAAAVMADLLALECDFFSIGTNDLIQYTVAVDRGNEKVANLYSQYNPAVLRLVQMTIRAAHDNNIVCGMCGEAAGDPLLIPALLGMGLDEFSMSSGSVLRARKIISQLSSNDTQGLVHEIINLPTAEEVEQALIDFAATHALA